MRFAFRVALSMLLVGSALVFAKPDSSPPAASGTAGVRDVKAPAHLRVANSDTPVMAPPVAPDLDNCCGNSKAPVGPQKRYLGRAVPKAQYDYGHFRCVVGQDGKARYFARLSKHTDGGKRAAPLPASIDWSTKAANVLGQMYLNDQYGDCVIASRYHQIGFWSASLTGTGVIGTNNEVYASYQSACGRGDNGCDMSAVNQYQQKTGLSVAGAIHKTDGSVAVDWTNQDMVKTALVVFGGLNVGLNLPNDWYQSADGSDWGPTNSRIVGGHEVQAFGYDDKGVWISTWAGKRRILWAQFTSKQWIDEVYTTLSPDWYGSDKLAPNGIDATTLAADLLLIANGQIPPLPNPTPPTPPTPPVPTPPAPPTPGSGFTGSMVYVNGQLVAVTTGGSSSLSDELKVAGVDPAIIADVLQLVSDLKGKKGFAVYMLDLMKIVTDLGILERKVSG